MEKQNPLCIIIPMVLTIILASKHLHRPLELSRNRADSGSDLISVYSLCTKRWYALASSRCIFQKEPISIVQGKSLAWRSILKFLHSDWEGLGVNGHLERGSSRAPGQCLTQELLANSFLHLQSGDKKNMACWPRLTLISSSGWMWNVYSLHAGVDLLWSSISAFCTVCYKWLIVFKHDFPFVF